MSNGATSRTAVYGPVRTVVWQGTAGDRCPYADQVGQGPEFQQFPHLLHKTEDARSLEKRTIS